MMSDHPRDLAEEVRPRHPVNSLRGFRSACKQGKYLSKGRSFTKKHDAQAKAATKMKKELPAKLAMLSDLPRDLAEDVLIRLPATSLRVFRSACKKGKYLSKDRSFTKKHLTQAKAATKKKELPAKLTMMSDLPRGLAACKKGNYLSKDRSFTKHHLTQAKAAKAATKKKELPANLTMMSDLPRDLAEEVLIRLPVTSLRVFRSTCKQWNYISKDRSFAKKHVAQAAAAEFMVVMVMEFRVYLMALDFHGTHKGVDPSINLQGKLITLDDSDRVDISLVYHCDGLLLCITEDFARFVVWNPYLGQTLWLKPRSPHDRLDWYRYAIGYQNSNSCRSYKILRFVDAIARRFVEYEIYELKSNSWRVLDVTSDWHIEFYARGVSVKGNTYWFAQEKHRQKGQGEIADFLICFDFTAERFGPRLGLPFHSYTEDTVTLSSVRDEQLAVLFQRWDTLQMEIWITTKIEPKEVSWNKLFLAADMEPLTDFQFAVTHGSFFIDEEKRVAVVFDKDKDMCPTRNIAYIIGEDGYFRQVDLGKSVSDWSLTHSPFGCSYVPSLTQINQ